MTSTTIVRPADPTLRAALRLALAFATVKLATFGYPGLQARNIRVPRAASSQHSGTQGCKLATLGYPEASASGLLGSQKSQGFSPQVCSSSGFDSP